MCLPICPCLTLSYFALWVSLPDATRRGTSDGSTNRLRGAALGLPAGALEDQRAEKRWATQSKNPGESKFSSGLASKFHHGPVAGDNVTVIKADGTGKVRFFPENPRG